MTVRASVWRGFAVACALAGCVARGPQIYTGPTITLDELAEHINANNSRIPTLWAHQDFDGEIVDEKHNSHSVSAQGVLLYRGPSELRIVGDSDFGTPIFELGVNEQDYWLKVVPQLDTLWWGHLSDIGKPNTQRIPIRPDLILDVLAVGTLDQNFKHEPFPVMRFNNDADAFMVDWLVRGEDRLLIRKEVWYPRESLLPGLVLLFDNRGRAVLRAHLTDFKPVPIDNLPKDQQPLVATKFDLFFPDTGSSMRFTLTDLALTHNGIPHVGSIHLPDLDRGDVSHVVELDKDLGK
jgi:hypothetical protein